jgi:hypothetical protein
MAHETKQSGAIPDELEEQHEAALKAAVSAYSEMQLIAPDYVRIPAYKYFDSLSGDKQTDYEARDVLIAAVRVDLGEPADYPPEIEGP